MSADEAGHHDADLVARAPGKYPKPETLRAEVLAVLLSSENMAGIESVFATSGARLGTVVRALTRRYGWPIERREFATNTPDGRAAWVSMFVLPAPTIASAVELGAGDWIAKVKVARAGRRAALQRRAAPCECVEQLYSA